MIQSTCYLHSTHISNTCCGRRRRPTGSQRSYNGPSLIIVVLLLLLQQVSSNSSPDACTSNSHDQVDSDALRSFSLLLKRLQPLQKLFNVVCAGGTEAWPSVHDELMALGHIATSKTFNDFKDLLRLSIPREAGHIITEERKLKQYSNGMMKDPMPRSVRSVEECKEYESIFVTINTQKLNTKTNEIVVNIGECDIIRTLPYGTCTYLPTETQEPTSVSPTNVTTGTGKPVSTITTGTPTITTTTESIVIALKPTESLISQEDLPPDLISSTTPATGIPGTTEECVTANLTLRSDMVAMMQKIESISKNISAATLLLINCTHDKETLKQTTEYIKAMNKVMNDLSNQVEAFRKEAWPDSSVTDARQKRLFSGFSTHFDELKLIGEHAHQGEPVHCPVDRSSFSESFAEVDLALTSLGEDPTNPDLADQLYCTGSHLADMAAKIMQGSKSRKEKDIEKANHAIVTKSIIEQVLKIVEEKEKENTNQSKSLEKEINELKAESNEIEANLIELQLELEQ